MKIQLAEKQKKLAAINWWIAVFRIKNFSQVLGIKKESPGKKPGASASPKLLQEGLAKVGSIK